MSAPQAAYSDTTAIPMSVLSDLEGGKKSVNVTVTSVDSPQRPILGRRRTSDKAGTEGVEQTAIYVHEEDGLTKVGNFLWKIHSTSILT